MEHPLRRGPQRSPSSAGGRRGPPSRCAAPWSAITPATTSSFPTVRGGERRAGRRSPIPPSCSTTLRPAIRRPDDLGAGRRRAVRHGVAARSSRGRSTSSDDLSHFKWALATAQSVPRIGLELWQREHPDVLLVYIEGTDSTAHLFGHLFRAQRSRRRAGRAAGEVTAARSRRCTATPTRSSASTSRCMDDRTTLIVLSDHGFELGELPDDPSTTRDMRRVSERYHRIDGILYLYGRDVPARDADRGRDASSTSRRRCSRSRAWRRRQTCRDGC